MINIAIIDDDPSLADHVQKIARESIAGEEEVSVYVYTDAKKLLDEVDDGIRFHILISDIQMPDVDGIELGQRLKKKWPNIYLIYITFHEEYAVRSYRIGAYQYIMKDEIAERLPEILLRLVESLKKEFKSFVIKSEGKSIEKVYYADLLSIRKVKSSKYVEYKTADGSFVKRCTLEEAMAGAQNHEFIVIERGCAVNMRHIRKIEDLKVTMDNGDELSISYKRLARVREWISRHWGELC